MLCSADGQPLSKNELKKRAKDAEKAEKAAKRAAREAEEARVKKEKDDQVSHSTLLRCRSGRDGWLGSPRESGLDGVGIDRTEGTCEVCRTKEELKQGHV